MQLADASRIGVIVNPRAGRAPAAAAWRAMLPGAHVAATDTNQALTSVLHAMQAEGVGLLVSVGGDGTLSNVLTAAHATWRSADAAELPAVVPVAAGTMNMMARQTGWSMRPARAGRWLANVCRQQRPLSVMARRSLLCGGKQVGFVAGFGMPARFLSAYGAGTGGVASALGHLSRFAISGVMQRGENKGLFAPIRLRWGTEQATTSATWNLGLVTRLNALPLNFRVAPGAADDALLHLLCGEPTAVQLLRELPNLYRGKVADNLAVQSQRVPALHVAFDQPTPWMLDGDVFAPVSVLTLTDGPAFRFVVPG